IPCDSKDQFSEPLLSEQPFSFSPASQSGLRLWVSLPLAQISCSFSLSSLSLLPCRYLLSRCGVLYRSAARLRTHILSRNVILVKRVLLFLSMVFAARLVLVFQPSRPTF